MAKAAAKKDDSVQIVEISTGTIECCIVGISPLICNSMSSKVKEELLFPKGRKNAAEKAVNLKHDPYEEFRQSPYRSKDPDSPTYILGRSDWFKKAMLSAALDMPGATKSQMGRLTYVEGTYVDIYGIPQILTSVTRCADIKRTPDVHTRAILPQWACKFTLSYVKPILNQQMVMNLISAAGLVSGVGDWRQEKGSGNHGQYRICSADDPEFIHIIKTGGRQAQLDAMEDPEMFDVETEELLSWFNIEVKRRGMTEKLAVVK